VATAVASSAAASRAGIRLAGRSAPAAMASCTRRQRRTDSTASTPPVAMRNALRPCRRPCTPKLGSTISATPPPISARAVRVQARKVRSLARVNR
jgi:hypothetical protein